TRACLRSAVIDIVLSFPKTKKHKVTHSRDVVQQGSVRKQEKSKTLTYFRSYIGKKVKILVLNSILKSFFK
ncbi:hypothetical protein, partial [Bartonella sp. AD328YNZD]|uniref:hypothetical protein n=1 Tax=Bartonella sp. AD328YNZD TaxID=3243464 RepID=UPI0035CF0463